METRDTAAKGRNPTPATDRMTEIADAITIGLALVALAIFLH